MIQIWKKTENGDIIVSVQDSMENARYFCEKNRIENAELVKVIE